MTRLLKVLAIAFILASVSGCCCIVPGQAENKIKNMRWKPREEKKNAEEKRKDIKATAGTTEAGL